MNEIRDKVKSQIFKILNKGMTSKYLRDQALEEILSIRGLAVVGCLQCPKCGIIISEEEVKCQLSDKQQEEEK
jgi:hypothetical protein